MRRKRDRLDWAANTRRGNVVMITAGVVMGFVIVAIAWILANFG